jgi:hypothetical protein
MLAEENQRLTRLLDGDIFGSDLEYEQVKVGFS